MGGNSSKNKNLLIGSVLGISTILLATYLIKDKNQPLQSQTQNSQMNNENQKIALVAGGIQVNYSDFEILSMETIVQIQQKCLELVGEDFEMITVGNRKLRRQLSHTNLQEYAELILEYHLSIEELLDHKQDLLLQELGIDKEQMNNSVVKLMESGYFEQFFMVQASIRQKIKQKITTNKSIDIYELKEVVKYQISITQERKQELNQILSLMMNNINQDLQQLAPLAISTVIADMTYEKFKVEEEEIIKILVTPGVIQQQEVQQLMMSLEQAMVTLLSPFDPQQK